MNPCFLFTVASLCLALGAPVHASELAQKPAPDAEATLVVYNENDPVSVDLAGYYAEKRGIPFTHLIGLSSTTGEVISRADYDRCIANPLRTQLIERGWWQVAPAKTPGGPQQVEASSIRFVALMRGIPLKIAPVPNYPGDMPERIVLPELRQNGAAVDSELSTLAQGVGERQITGPSDNPYYEGYARLDQEPIPGLLLVCRLDAASPGTVRRMIDDALAAEKTGLWGTAYLDSRHILNGGYAMGDEWLRKARNDEAKYGIPCVFDDAPSLFPDHYPARQAALYFGWYSGEITGPFKEEAFRFVPGAIAVHIHSFSADTLRSPQANWCAPLLERGAAATIGNVYEPFLPLTPNLGIFQERLFSGFTFAEAAYASMKGLSWMTTFIGDPLYRPFKAQQQAGASPPPWAAEWVAYRDAARLWFSKDRPTGEQALMTKGKELKSGLIWEGLGNLQAFANDPQAAMRSWQQAGRYYRDAEDRARCALYAITALRGAGKKEEALTVLRKQLKTTPPTGAGLLLRAIETEMTAPPPTPTPASTPGATPAKPAAPK